MASMIHTPRSASPRPLGLPAFNPAPGGVPERYLPVRATPSAA
jgi:hypothetical protein